MSLVQIPITRLLPDKYQELQPLFDAIQKDLLALAAENAELAQAAAEAAQVSADAAQVAADQAQASADAFDLKFGFDIEL